MNIRKPFLSLVVAGLSAVALLALLSTLGGGLRFDDWLRSAPPETREIEVGTEGDGRPRREEPPIADGLLAPLATLPAPLGDSVEAPAGVFPITLDDRPVQPRERPAKGRFGPQRRRGAGPGDGDLGTEIGPGSDGRRVGGGRKEAGRKHRRQPSRAARNTASRHAGERRARPSPARVAVRSVRSPGSQARSRGGNGNAKAGGHSGRHGRK